MRISNLAVLSATVLLVGCAARAAPDGRLTSAEANYTLGDASGAMPVTVRVEDASGRAVAGAQVLLVAGYSFGYETPMGGEGFVGSEAVAEGVSGPDGRFRASPQLSKHVNCLDAAAIRGSDSGVSGRQFAPRLGKDELVVVLTPGVTFRGRVVDDAGRPVPGAAVECSWPGNDFTVRSPAGADGGFACGPVPAAHASEAWMSAVHRGPVRIVWSKSITGDALAPDKEIVLVVNPVPDTPENRK
jgi:hypothetical protein